MLEVKYDHLELNSP